MREQQLRALEKVEANRLRFKEPERTKAWQRAQAKAEREREAYAAERERIAALPKARNGSPCCGARLRGIRAGRTCRAPAVWDNARGLPRNGRCRLHGGLSTGAKTPEGKANIRAAQKQRRAREAQAKADLALLSTAREDTGLSGSSETTPGES